MIYELELHVELEPESRINFILHYMYQNFCYYVLHSPDMYNDAV